jgi:hypothetical protein
MSFLPMAPKIVLCSLDLARRSRPAGDPEEHQQLQLMATLIPCHRTTQLLRAKAELLRDGELGMAGWGRENSPVSTYVRRRQWPQLPEVRDDGARAARGIGGR